MASVTLRLINNDQGPQTLKTRPGDVFTLQIWVFPNSANAGGGTLQLALGCTDSKGVNAATTVNAASVAVPAKGAWTQISGTVTVPTGYDTVDPRFIMTSVPAGDVIYVDDPLVREMSAAQNLADSIYQALTGTSTSNNPWASIGTQFSTMVNNLFSGGTVGTVGKLLKPAAIPGLDGSIITSGAIAQSFLNITSIASTLVSGLLKPNNIPTLDASILTSGTLLSSIFPNITKAMSTDLQTTITNLFGGAAIGTQITTGALPSAIPSSNVPALIAATTAANMVLNPDFENSALWTGASGTQSAAQSHSGTKSWSLTGAG